MNMTFSGEVIYWRGPAPWFFVTVPEDESEVIQDISGEVTYGWGVIPVSVRLGETVWQTSLFPKDGRYLVPVKARVRAAEKIEEGDVVTIRIDIRWP